MKVILVDHHNPTAVFEGCFALSDPFTAKVDLVNASSGARHPSRSTADRLPHGYLLRRDLCRHRLSFTEGGHLDDPGAAAAVRAASDGNETVPTVHVAGQWLVNPCAGRVKKLVSH
jgi:mycoredoxin